MHRDPRNPDPNYMVRTESAHEFHSKLRKTVVLLKVTQSEPTIYCVVEGLSEWPATLEEMRSHAQYFYEEHTCPTNWLGIPMISVGGDHDPHGLFEFVDAVWMMDEYRGAEERWYYLLEVFPQLTPPA